MANAKFSMTSEGGRRQRDSIVPPRTINLQKFAEARSCELHSLHSIVSNRLNNDFKTSRYKRRRTTAYENQVAKKQHEKKRQKLNPNKVDDPGAEGGQKRVSRRARRRAEFRMNPEVGFCTASDGTKRLRTHVWHTKRFTMTKLWGFYLPLGLHGSGRGSKALLKWYRQGAIIHDASYHVAVQLEGSEESLMSILKMVLVSSPCVVHEDSLKLLVSGASCGTAMLHHVGAPFSQPIAPVTYAWRPLHPCDRASSGFSTRQVWLWLHASAFSEGFEALNVASQNQIRETGMSIKCRSLEGELANLEVMGKNSLSLLQKTFFPFSCGDQADSWKMERCCMADIGSDSSCCSVLSLIARDPRQVSTVKPTVNCRDGTSNEKGYVGDLHVASLAKHEDDGSPLANKSLWDGCSAVSPPMEDSVVCLEKYYRRMHFACIDDKKLAPEEILPLQNSSRSCPILLLKKGMSTIDSHFRWSVILPLSWARVFWNSLISNGAHAIGLRERRWIACDVGLPHFPHDFPDCKAHSSFMEIHAASIVRKEKMLLPAVKPTRVPIFPPWNCVRATLSNRLASSSSSGCVDSPTSTPLFDGIIARTSPMLADYLSTDDFCLLLPQAANNSQKPAVASLKDLPRGSSPCPKLCFVRVLLTAYKKGVFEEGAIVCAPLSADVSIFTSGIENVDPGLQMSQSLVGTYFKEDSLGQWELQLSEDCVKETAHRWPIGFVTTGFVRGSKKPCAEAYCEACLLAHLRKEQWNEMLGKERTKEIYVLVRNLRSCAYRLALAQVFLQLDEDVDDLRFL